MWHIHEDMTHGAYIMQNFSVLTFLSKFMIYVLISVFGKLAIIIYCNVQNIIALINDFIGCGLSLKVF